MKRSMPRKFDREEANRQRAALSRECLAMVGTHRHLLIELPTGTGKGLIVANCIRNSVSPKRWLVLVPERLQIDNYRADLIKHGNGDLLDGKIHDIICYASLKKYEGTSFNVHLNEAHRVSEHRMDILKTIAFDQLLSDSATVSPEVKERLSDICPFHTFYRSLQEVIDLGILPEPAITCLDVPLDGARKHYLHTFGKTIGKLTAVEKYDVLCKNIAYWGKLYKEEYKPFQKNKWMQAALQRKQFLAAYKTEFARQLLSGYEGRRYVCFCGSVQQAQELGGVNAIHSKQSKKENVAIVDAFNQGATPALFSCMMGVEGMNFSGVDTGFILQLDNTERLPIQKAGRVFRSNIPELVVLYVPGTQDEVYLNRFLSNFDPRFIHNYEQKEETLPTPASSGIRGKLRN